MATLQQAPPETTMLLMMTLAACKPTNVIGWDTGTPEPVVVVDGMLTTTLYSTHSDAEGLIEVPVEVGNDTTALMVALSVRYERPALLAVINPSGEIVLDAADWLGGDEDLTDAFDVARHTGAVNWPTRDLDPPLTPGTWVTLWASTHQEGGTNPKDPTDVAVMTKDDPDLSNGTITVRLVWADGVDQRVGAPEAAQAAVDTWSAAWAPYGLDIVATFHTSTLDPTLPFTANGDGALIALSEEIADPGDVVVVLGDTMLYKPGVFGSSAGTPGSVAPSDYRFVAVALDMFLDASGGYRTTDSAQELTDTISHEVSHFMGLPHVVSSDFDTWDALPDTERCTSKGSCESQLGTNLMFPYGYCAGACGPRSFTQDQVGVLQRSVAAR